MYKRQITGGLGGLGLRAAAMLVETGATCVVISSRSGSGGVSEAMDAAAERSATMHVVACDVSEAADAFALLALAAPMGLLHAAGVLRDTMLRSMAAGGVDAVCAPKALAASHVQAIVTRTPLEAMGLFSSVASTFGNVGQANYAAANAYLDALARCHRCHGTVGSSLQIPAVSGAGMGATTFDSEQLDAMGGVSLDEFAACLSVALAPARGATEQTLAPLARSLLARAEIPALSELVPDTVVSAVASFVVAPAAGTALARSLVHLGPPHRQASIEASVLRVVRELTGAPAACLLYTSPSPRD